MTTRFAICAMVLLSTGMAYAKEGKTPHGVKPEDVVKAKFELLQIEKNIVTYTNEQRKRYGLAPLEIDQELVASARDHAIWMTRNRTLQHTRRPVAENIAMGYPSSQSVVRGWMNSSGHRANILNRGYRRIGVAAYRTASGTIYWCQQFRR
ncbi:MAG: CAP domain-containing protein [Pirellulales bacterium]|nr:CAP domain-containing protein [Pirellulales bacterium]